MPKWSALAGYVIGVALLLLVGIVPWLQLLFPTWVFLLSLMILYSHYRRPREGVHAGRE